MAGSSSLTRELGIIVMTSLSKKEQNKKRLKKGNEKSKKTLKTLMCLITAWFYNPLALFFFPLFLLLFFIERESDSTSALHIRKMLGCSCTCFQCMSPFLPQIKLILLGQSVSQSVDNHHLNWHEMGSLTHFNVSSILMDCYSDIQKYWDTSMKLLGEELHHFSFCCPKYPNTFG